MELTWYPAPGKLNLFLHILGRRPDGYHELQTVFRLIDRCERLPTRYPTVNVVMPCYEAEMVPNPRIGA